MAADQFKRSPRKAFERLGWVEFEDGSSILNCVIENISDTGAKLIFKDASEVPDSFILWLSQDGRVARQCQVVRRSGREFGVRFTARIARREGREFDSLEA
jgi:hypothetical protein